MQPIWTYEHGRLWATLSDGRCVVTWEAAPTFGVLTDLLNACPALSELLMAGWQGQL
jgi:hypothetical protein